MAGEERKMYYTEQISQQQEPDCPVPKGLAQAERTMGGAPGEKRGREKAWCWAWEEGMET